MTMFGITFALCKPSQLLNARKSTRLTYHCDLDNKYVENNVDLTLAASAKIVVHHYPLQQRKYVSLQFSKCVALVIKLYTQNYYFEIVCCQMYNTATYM